jgi:hypothetical protein
MYRYLIIAVISGISGGIIARAKGYNQFLWGVLCTVIPLLVLVILVMPVRVYEVQIKKCPHCGALVREGDTSCRQCGKNVHDSV